MRVDVQRKDDRSRRWLGALLWKEDGKGHNEGDERNDDDSSS